MESSMKEIEEKFNLNDKNIVSLELSNEDDAYLYFVQWLAQQEESIHYIKHVDANIRSGKNEETNKTEQKFLFSPAVGTCYMQLKGRLVQLHSWRQYKERGVNRKFLRIATPDDPNRQFLEGILKEAVEAGEARAADKLTIYNSFAFGSWEKFGAPRKRRPLSTVFLDEAIIDSLLHDLHEFLASKLWYEERGVPFRRGYLLFGPPGCGKTSIIKALASEINHAISILNLSGKKMNDDTLSELMSVIPATSIVLVEDISSLFKQTKILKSVAASDERTNETNRSGEFKLVETVKGNENETVNSVTYSGLLNAIDGVASSDDGRILFFTTNHIELLEPALLRPGRIDRKFFINYPSERQLRKIFHCFYPNAAHSLAVDFIEQTRQSQKRRSVADIQGHFMMFKNNPEEAIKTLNNDDYSLLRQMLS